MDTVGLNLCFNGLNQIYYHPNNTSLSSLTSYYFNLVYEGVYEEARKLKQEIIKESFLNGLSKAIETLPQQNYSSLNYSDAENLVINSIRTYLISKENFNSENCPNIQQILNCERFLKETTLLHYIVDVNYILTFSIWKSSKIKITILCYTTIMSSAFLSKTKFFRI